MINYTYCPIRNEIISDSRFKPEMPLQRISILWAILGLTLLVYALYGC